MRRWTGPQQTGALRGVIGATHLATSSLVLNALSVFAMAYIIRGLGPTAYGQWATATALISFLGVATNLGLRGTFVRQVARTPESAPAQLAYQLGSRLILAALAAPAAVLLSVGLGYSGIIIQCTAVAAVGMAPGVVSAAFGDLLQGSHRLSTLAMGNFVGGLLLTCASIVAIALGAGPVLLSVAYLVGPIAAAVFLMVALKRQGLPVAVRFSPRQLIASIKESRFFGAQAVVSTAGANAAALLLPKLVGVADFGFFAAGSLIASRLEVIPESLGTAYYPLIVAAAADDPRNASRLVWRGMGWALLACVPIALCATVLAGPIARILFPGQAEICGRVIRVTVWALPLSALSSVMSYALYASGRDATVAKLSLWSTVLGLFLTIGLVVPWGVVGASWSLVLRMAVGCGLALPTLLSVYFAKARRHG
jgi:lipopolysaccharide exporter